MQPRVLVPKPDGFIHFCIDVRQLNAASTFYAYPMHRIDVLLHQVIQAPSHSTLDLSK